MDTVERIRDGLRRDIVSFIDPASRLAFAWAVPTKHARHTRRALDRTLSLFPKPPEVVLSDNGREFEAGFAEALAEQGIRRWSTDPKTPKMNAHAERFNRTLAPSRSPSSTITRISSSPTSLSSTGSWPSGSCSPTPSGRTKDSTAVSAILSPSPPTGVPKVVDLYSLPRHVNSHDTS